VYSCIVSKYHIYIPQKEKYVQEIGELSPGDKNFSQAEIEGGISPKLQNNYIVFGNSQVVKVLTQNLPGIFALKIAPNLAETASCTKLLAGRVLALYKTYVLCMQIRPSVCVMS
jgi:hypothetical protein